MGSSLILLHSKCFASAVKVKIRVNMYNIQLDTRTVDDSMKMIKFAFEVDI